MIMHFETIGKKVGAVNGNLRLIFTWKNKRLCEGDHSAIIITGLACPEVKVLKIKLFESGVILYGKPGAIRYSTHIRGGPRSITKKKKHNRMRPMPPIVHKNNNVRRKSSRLRNYKQEISDH